ncbi:MAG: hypothetical protein PHD51_00765 [Patescibacteria group bacterium]|nr:hypothetical protein [Patescibacteria group bacterium]MDD5490602.1 hypothetical protein [Patescibacteria group bacterium]
MNKNIFRVLIVVSFAIISVFVIGSFAMAQEEVKTETPQAQNQTAVESVQYPVKELGNCKDREDCKVFCNETKNTDVCLAFGEDHGLMKAEEVSAAKKFQAVGMTGPGECQGTDACEDYCDNKDNLETCVAFAEKNELLPEEDLQEAKKIVTAVKSGVKPLSCTGRKDCENYCASAKGMEACINFGTEAGILPAAEQENARKVLTAIKNGAVPPCHGTECEVYCREGSEHAAECGSFATTAGILSPPKMRQLQKMLNAMEEGVELPGCGEEGCQDYCSQEAHFEECVKFAEATGAMTTDEAQAAMKTGGEGPGGCKTKEECDAFCNAAANSEVCFNFAKDNGMISEEDQKTMQEGQQKIQESLNNMPAEISVCLTSSLGADTIEKLKSGSVMPNPTIGTQMKTCFESFTPIPPARPEGQDGQNQGSQGDREQGQGGGGQDGGPSNSGPNQGEGFNPGSGQGGGQGQNTNPNPVKCIEDCELTGRDCISALSVETEACRSQGQYCREVTCETKDAEGNRSTAEVMRACIARVCDSAETACHALVTAKSSACTTNKDVCVMNCQKAAKPVKPEQTTQPVPSTESGQPTPPTPPEQPTKPSKPAKPTQSGESEQPAKPAKPTPPSQPTLPTQPTPPAQPTPPTQPTQPSPPAPPNQPQQPPQPNQGN